MDEKELNKFAGGYNSFDTDHSSFRIYEFTKFMDLREKEYVNNFKFEGDENFTLAKQRTFLKQCFRHGYAGIINTSKIVQKNLSQDGLRLVEILNLPIANIIKEVMSDHIPVAVAPILWDNTERFVQGTAFTTSRHNVDRKVYRVSANDTAFLQFDTNHMSGMMWWLVPAYLKSLSSTVLKKRLSLVDGKIVQNTVNNDQADKTYDEIYNVNKSSVDLSPAQKSITGGSSNEINIMTMIDQKLKKLDMSNGESIVDLLSFVETHEKIIMMSQGKRVNLNEGKQERSISQDFESMEVYFRLLEQEAKDQMEMFIQDYKRIFGVQLTLKCLTDETLNELKEQQLANSGRGNEEGGNDGKDKTETV